MCIFSCSVGVKKTLNKAIMELLDAQCRGADVVLACGSDQRGSVDSHIRRYDKYCGGYSVIK